MKKKDKISEIELFLSHKYPDLEGDAKQLTIANLLIASEFTKWNKDDNKET